MSAEPRLQIELLGGWRLTGTDGRVLRVPSRKAQALLACLALQPGTAVPRELLAQLLWDTADQELARASLRQALSALRRTLGATDASTLVCETATVMLDAQRTTCDVACLREVLREASPLALVQEADRYARELLPGFDARSGGFDAWLDEHRRALRRDWMQGLQRLAAQSVRVGDPVTATHALAQLVAAEPTSESAQRDLMSLYLRQGRYVDALRQYRACCDALRRDLDVAPDPATEALHREILRRRRATEGPAAEPGVTTGDASSQRSGPATTLERTADSPSPPARTLATLREAVVLVAHVGADSAHGDDPEAQHTAWTRSAHLVDHTVADLGGIADRPSQGEIVAVFGLDGATGNELQRVVQAARRLTDTVGGVERPAFGIGIARGLVLPADGTTPFPLAGQAVAAARRLARSAPLGSTVLAPDIAAQLPERETRPVAPDISPDTGAASPRLLVAGPATTKDTDEALAGRRAELAMLDTLLERVRASGKGRVVVLRGDPGIGKSTLLGTLATAAQGRAAVHVTHILDFGQPVRERPRATLAARWLDLPDGHGAVDVLRRAVATRIADGQIESADLSAVLDLLALAPGDDLGGGAAPALEPAARERAQASLMQRLLERAASVRPQLVIVEDAHWADPTEIAQLAEFARALAQWPVLLAISTRLDGDPFTAAWRARARGSPVTVLDLAPLAEDEARELASRYAGVTPDRLDHCVETAAGNPLFLVQLLRSAQAGQASLPGTVRALLLARVERLPEPTQRLLHAAAVLGLRFEIDALCHVAAAGTVSLRDLEAPGLLACDGVDCQFTHALVRAAIHESLLRSTRTALHQRAATWFESRDPSLHAEHLAAAEHPGAAAAHLRAAEAELQAYRLERATTHAERAVALARTPDERCDAQATLGAICAARGRTEPAIDAYRASAVLATTAAQRARAGLGLAGSLRIVDRYDEALEVLAHAEADVLADGDRRRLAQVWTLRGNLHFPRGELDQCRAAHERALVLAEQAGATEDVARALGGLCDAHYQRGSLVTALDYGQRCLELADSAGLVHLRLAYLSMVASCLSYHGEFDRALEATHRIVTDARRIGDLRSELLACAIEASLATYRTEYPRAIECSARSLQLARELGAGRFEAEALIQQGVARCYDDDLATGRGLLEQATERARQVALTYCGPWAFSALALHCGDEQRGRELLAEGERGLELGAVSHNHLEYRYNAIELMLVLRDAGGALAHAEALANYTRQEPLGWAGLVIDRARLVADSLAGRPVARSAVEAVLARAGRIRFQALVPRLETLLGGGA